MDSPVHGRNAKDAKRHQRRDIRTRHYHATSRNVTRAAQGILLTLFLDGVMTYLGGRCGIRRERTPPIRNNEESTAGEMGVRTRELSRVGWD
ncbi:hypothetical protein BD310DRAFT_338870 [Dichomitus squalens]|uniref:Uncharacterized protein n=1 Tax=Dichomitus squalens TaxID=114155 RepID=A0A4Q9PZJ9_9APHY|nr:hypothetical protein BD310DRAFT_338870 [Dichomitus squalens]